MCGENTHPSTGFQSINKFSPVRICLRDRCVAEIPVRAHSGADKPGGSTTLSPMIPKSPDWPVAVADSA